VVVDHTFASEMLYAVILKQVFVQQTGIAVRDVTRLLARIARAQIVVVHDEADTYSFQPDNNRWLYKPRLLSGRVIQRVLPMILAPGRDFKTALAELGIEEVIRKLSTAGGGDLPPDGSPGGNCLPPDSRTYITGVPEYRTTGVTGLVGTGLPVSGGDSPPNREDELLRQCVELFGRAYMTQHGGVWRLRSREDTRAVAEALAATKLARDRNQNKWKSGPGQYANKCYQEERRRQPKEIPA